MKHVVHKIVVLLLFALIAGCAAPQPKIDVVAQTLQTYQAGKTTFTDFKRDAGLVIAERPAPNIPSQQSNLNPPPAVADQLRPRMHKTYGVPEGSPWKIYEVGETTNVKNGRFSQTTKFVVGDIKRPISILTFDAEGKLTGAAPVL